MEDDLKNGRWTQNWKTTSKMEDDLNPSIPPASSFPPSAAMTLVTLVPHGTKKTRGLSYPKFFGSFKNKHFLLVIYSFVCGGSW